MRDLAGAEAAITASTARFSGLRGIETAEREVLAKAAWLLGRSDGMVRLGGMEEQAARWFNDARDF
ncbi:MAG: hypothetical protein E7K72_00770 [Roseomonas mucosa]|nr:hypothetical protein [Roseomonas mucosa]